MREMLRYFLYGKFWGDIRGFIVGLAMFVGALVVLYAILWVVFTILGVGISV